MNETSQIEIRCRRNKQEEQEAVSRQASGQEACVGLFLFPSAKTFRFSIWQRQLSIDCPRRMKERKEMSFVTRLVFSAVTSYNHHNPVLVFKSRKVKATNRWVRKGQERKFLRVRTFGDVGQWARLAAALPAPPVLESVPVVNHFCALYVVFYVFVEKF